MAKTYDVTIKEKMGSCESSLFEKMAQRGDLMSTKLADIVGTNVTIQGYSRVAIHTDDKDFELMYIDTDEYGLVSTGSEIFYESVKDYIEETKSFIIKEIKTKKGKTYKVSPVLNAKQNDLLD